MSRSRSKMTPLSALVLLMAVQMLGHSSVLVDASSNSTSPSASGSSNGSVSTTTTSTLCDSQLLFQKLYVLMPAINQCAMESDYFIKPDNLSLPSEASLDKFCSSKNCSQLSVELDNAGLPSCSVPVGNSTLPFKVFFKDIKTHCDNATAAPVPATPSSGANAQFYPTVDAHVRHVVLATVLVVLVSVGAL